MFFKNNKFSINQLQKQWIHRNYKPNTNPNHFISNNHVNNFKSLKNSENAKNNTFKRDFKLLNFEDTKQIYRSRSTFNLIQNIIYLKSCRIPLINRYGPILLEHTGLLLEKPTKYTYFKHFCGGEHLDDNLMKKVIYNSSMRDGFQCILDYSVEGTPPSNASSAHNVSELFVDNYDRNRVDSISNVIKQSIIFSHEQNQIHKNHIKHIKDVKNQIVAPNRTSFAVVKITGICDVNVLQRVNEILSYCQIKSRNNRKIYNALQKELLPSFFVIEDYAQNRTPSFIFHDTNKPRPLSEVESERLLHTMNELDEMCVLNSNHNIPMLIDAEQLSFQAAIDQFHMCMCLKHNKNNLQQHQTPIIYNTYQLYLKDGLDRLKYDYEFARKNNKSFACKLVRGAYMRTESQRCLELKTPYPVNDSIEQTHQMYDNGVKFIMDKISKTNDVALVIASHNQSTIEQSCESIVHEYDFPRNSPKIQFAQLYGMGDSMSLVLSSNGFNISKYIPFGPLREVMPYLGRRILENGDMLNGTTSEIQKMEKEIKRRFSK